MNAPKTGWLSDFLKIFTPEPITVGSKWGWRSDKGNPWAKYAYEVEDVKDGFVLARCYGLKDGYRSNDTQSSSTLDFRMRYYRLDS